MNKNAKVLADFVKYCEEHKELRFWQALQAWIGKDVVLGLSYDDPFYWEDKDK